MFEDIYNVGIDIVFKLKKIIKFEEYTYIGQNEEQKETDSSRIHPFCLSYPCI